MFGCPTRKVLTIPAACGPLRRQSGLSLTPIHLRIYSRVKREGERAQSSGPDLLLPVLDERRGADDEALGSPSFQMSPQDRN
jgi:hypothetical protein